MHKAYIFFFIFTELELRGLVVEFYHANSQMNNQELAFLQGLHWAVLHVQGLHTVYHVHMYLLKRVYLTLNQQYFCGYLTPCSIAKVSKER